MSAFGDAQEILVNHLIRIHPPDFTDDRNRLFAFVGKLRKLWGYEPVLKVLTNMREGSSVSYIIGACKKEFERSIDYPEEIFRRLSSKSSCFL